MSGRYAAPAVCAVVPTFRRPELLGRCLRALLAQDLEPDKFEIVVADDGPDAETERLVRTLARESPRHALRYLAVTATQGPAGARNRGSRASSAAWIAFTDDDTIPERNWLRAGLAAIQEDTIALSGTILVPLPARPTDYERDAAGLAHAQFATANCFVRRTAFEQIGGFDERFTAAWREDSDLQFRLMAAYPAALIRTCPEAIVVHPVRPAPWGVSVAQQRKSIFDALLYKKHAQLYRSQIAVTGVGSYYMVAGCLLTAGAAAVLEAPTVLGLALGGWAVLTLAFALRRLRNTSRKPSHVLEMLATSAVIPPLSLFWRAVGAVRFRVLFI